MREPSPKHAMHTYLDFEKPISELEGKAQEMRRLSAEGGNAVLAEEAQKQDQKAEQLLKDIYSKLTPWQKTQVARHPGRPHFSDYVSEIIKDFTPLAGDRCFGEDAAIIGGIGRFRGRSVVVIGHEKGSDTKSRLEHNFGMARPEGYRKAVRLMEMADRFRMPVITLVDTPGAYPGKESEERGVAEAIARSTEACLQLSVPNVAVIIGEGGSGGAIALATANKVLMLEHSIYSVISPEGCASILWRDQAKAQDAAAGMRVGAPDLHGLGIVDGIIEEPIGGAHRDVPQIVMSVSDAIERSLQEMSNMDAQTLQRQRRQKFLDIGRKGLN